MARKETRKRKRFDATSVPVLSPKTLRKRSARPKTRSRTTRQRKKDSWVGKKVRAWGFSHYVAILLMLAGVAALVFFFTDARFQTAPPVVRGAHYLNAEEIAQRADLTGRNIYALDPQQIALQLTTFLPQMKEAHVRLALPNQAMITVVERQPVLAYGRGNQTYWADEEGHLFPAASDRADLPLIIDEDGSASPDGQHLAPGVLPAILEITRNIPEMKEFHYRQIYGLFFISPEGWRVYLGGGEDILRKLATWQTIRQQLLQENRPVKTVDLRYDRVYIQ